MRASSPTEKERPVSQPGSDNPSFALFSDFLFYHENLRLTASSIYGVPLWF